MSFWTISLLALAFGAYVFTLVKHEQRHQEMERQLQEVNDRFVNPPDQR